MPRRLLTVVLACVACEDVSLPAATPDAATSDAGGDSSVAPDDSGPVDGGADASTCSAPDAGGLGIPCCAQDPSLTFCSDFEPMNLFDPSPPWTAAWILVTPYAGGHAERDAQFAWGTGAAKFWSDGTDGGGLPAKAALRRQLGMKSGKTALHVAFDLHVEEFPHGGGDLYFTSIPFGADAAYTIALLVNTAGVLTLGQQIGTNAFTKTTLTTITSGSWHHVELDAATATQGDVVVRVDGTAKTTAMTVAPPAGDDPTLQIGLLYCDNGCGTYTLRFDDVVASLK